ncbi:unnamed protein product [Allacma fusca]|uniref:BTB domain-containing protein n=1 Tax=Allacma fusca TaxID=39272 RepID=A0A8J2LN48_9HEXA|nr:unnamed protein product [Allacma fusca]
MVAARNKFSVTFKSFTDITLIHRRTFATLYFKFEIKQLSATVNLDIKRSNMMEKAHPHLNGHCSNSDGRMDLVEEERDMKPRLKGKARICDAHPEKFFMLKSKDRVKLTNLNNQNYQWNPTFRDDREGENTSQGDTRKVVLPANNPKIGDSICSGHNWELRGLLCYTLGCDSNFHLLIKMSPGVKNEQVSIALNFEGCAKSQTNKEFFRTLQEYSVSAKLVGKDKCSVLATGAAQKGPANSGSWIGLNNQIDNFCSLGILKSADQIHLYNFPTAKDGDKLSGGEFDTVELEVDLKAAFRIQSELINYFKPFTCFQSFQPENLFRWTDRSTGKFKTIDSTVLTQKRPRWNSVPSGNSSRYAHIVALRVGPDQEELYAHKFVLTDYSSILKQRLAETTVLEFPSLSPEVIVLFLDILDEHRKGLISTEGTVPSSFQDAAISTLCEALKLIKDFQISLPPQLIQQLVSNIPHTLEIAFKIYSWGHEFGIKELMESGVCYFKEHKEELCQEQNKKMMEKLEPQVLVSVFSSLL